MRQFQVEYMSRPDEREHIETFDDFRRACIFAREMSDKHDGGAVCIALDTDQKGLARATGHIQFMFGIVQEKIGSLAKAVTAI